MKTTGRRAGEEKKKVTMAEREKIKRKYIRESIEV